MRQIIIEWNGIFYFGLTMANSFYNRPKKIEINCPYCWAEFTDFQQINGRIRYQNKMYDDFLILPVENAFSFPFYIIKRKFTKNQELEPVICNSCKREYTLVLFPFERKNRNNKFNVSKDLPKKFDKEVVPSFIEKFVPYDLNETSIKKNLLNFKYFLLVNFLLLVFLISSTIGDQSLLRYSILGVSIAELVLIVESVRFSKKMEDFYEIEKMPLIFHESYVKSDSFQIFKNHFFNFKKRKYENSETIAKYSPIIGIFLFGVLLLAGLSTYPNLISLVIVVFYVSFFFWVLSLILFAVMLLLLNSFEYLTLIATKIPLILDPWDHQQQIDTFKSLWIWALGIFIFSSVGLQVILNLTPISNTIKDAVLAKNTLQAVLTPLFSNPVGLIFIFVTSIVVLMFIIFLHSFDQNIKKRKEELIVEINSEIQNLKLKTAVSNSDILNSIILTNERKMIEEIPLFFWKWSTFALLIEALSVMIFFASPILAIILSQ
jgi:hypothetical protein